MGIWLLTSRHGWCLPWCIDILNAYAQYVELYINQLAYSMIWDSPLFSLSGKRTDGGLFPGFDRLECLWRSAESIKSWLDSFYKISPSELVDLPFHFWSQMVLCVAVLKYLVVLEDPVWDCQAVRNTVDVISVDKKKGNQTRKYYSDTGPSLPAKIWSGQSRRFTDFLILISINSL
jgi:hypothetical protein